MKTLDAIIIGAGAAGIAAGCRLLEKNVKNILLLEAKNRIGGRIHSYEVDGSFLDLGGQWCHGQENNIVYTLAKDLDLLSSSLNSYDEYTLYSPTLNVDKKLLEEIFVIAHNIEEDEDALKKFNGSFGDYFTNRLNAEIKEKYGRDDGKIIIANALCDWYHKMINCLNACPTWFDMSAKGSVVYKPCPGDYYLHFRDKGYKTILDVLMKKIPDNKQMLPLEEKICLNKTVKRIQWNNFEGAAVHCEDGSTYKAKCVLVTTSLGVLKKLQDTLFVPELPSYKLRAIKGLGFGVVNKIFLKFPSRWWFDDPKGISIIWSDRDRKFISKDSLCNSLKNGTTTWVEDIFGFYPIDSHDNVLLVWVVGKHASAVENLRDNEIIKVLMEILHYYVGHKYTIPKPIGVVRSRWSTDPHFYGSYSYRSNKSEDLNVFANDLARPVCYNNKPVLLFAGEATSDYQYSTVHGAISSGFREADRIVNFYKEKKSKL